MSMSSTEARPATVAYRPGDRLGLAGLPHQPNRWWVVRAADERFVVATMDLGDQGRAYTVIDLDLEVRGPLQTPNHGWADGRFNAEQCRDIVARMSAGQLFLDADASVQLEVLQVFTARRPRA